MLIYRGWHWLGGGFHWVLLLAFVLGSLKSFLVLDRITRRAVYRIRHFDDNTCLGAVYSWQSWLMVLLMVLTGVGVRHFWTPGPFLATLYLAIGWALLFSSRLGWMAYWHER